MGIKIQIGQLEEACNCPFYVKDGKGRRRCFIKQTTSVAVAMSMVEDNPDFDSDVWDQDCKGEYSACSVLPLLYAPEAPAASALSVHREMDGIEEFDPFEDEEAEAEGDAQAEPAEETVQVEVEPPVKQSATATVQVKLRVVKSPYHVNADALVYPTNQLLLIDDEDLNYYSQGVIQKECQDIVSLAKRSAGGTKPEGIRMGEVYSTSNGGSIKNGVVPKRIYHAVVASQMRLVNSQAIKDATSQALLVADSNGVRVLAMMPADCGTHDIYQTAEAQLRAIYNFLRMNNTRSLEYVVLVIDAADSVCQEAYQDYFDLIFG